jgi:hypothetical protein
LESLEMRVFLLFLFFGLCHIALQKMSSFGESRNESFVIFLGLFYLLLLYMN